MTFFPLSFFFACVSQFLYAYCLFSFSNNRQVLARRSSHARLKESLWNRNAFSLLIVKTVAENSLMPLSCSTFCSGGKIWERDTPTYQTIASHSPSCCFCCSCYCCCCCYGSCYRYSTGIYLYYSTYVTREFEINVSITKNAGPNAILCATRFLRTSWHIS